MSDDSPNDRRQPDGASAAEPKTDRARDRASETPHGDDRLTPLTERVPHRRFSMWTLIVAGIGIASALCLYRATHLTIPGYDGSSCYYRATSESVSALDTRRTWWWISF